MYVWAIKKNLGIIKHVSCFLPNLLTLCKGEQWRTFPQILSYLHLS